MNPIKHVKKSLLVCLCATAMHLTASAQSTAISGTTSVTLDFAALETAASLQLSAANNTAMPAAGFPAAFAITNETPFQYTEDPFGPVGGSIDHLGSVVFTIVGTATEVEVGDFTIGFDGARATGGNSGFFVEDTISGLGILFDVAAPDAVTSTTDGLFIAADLNVSPEFATYLSTNNLAATDLTGVEIGAAEVNASTMPITITSGRTSVNLDFNALETAASLQFTSVDNTASPAAGFPAGFAITDETPFQYTLGDFAPVGGNIGHTGSVTFTIVGTETLVEVGNFNIGFDAARAVDGNSGFFVEDTISSLGILFDVAAPSTLSATPDAFFAEAALNVSPEFATYLSDNSLATSDLSGVEIGSAQIDGFSAGLFQEAGSDNELLNYSALTYIAGEAPANFAFAGFIVGGPDPITVVVRARSTTINSALATEKLPDPTIEVYQGGVDGAIGANDNYVDAEGLGMLAGTSLDPVEVGMDPNESLLILEGLEPGGYTMTARSAVDGESGFVILEVFAVE